MADKPDPVEIVSTALRDFWVKRDTIQPLEAFEGESLAILSALEEHGAKVIFREPTQEMIYRGSREQCLDTHAFAKKDATNVFTACFDAAPKWGKR